jgi:xylose isomerase
VVPTAVCCFAGEEFFPGIGPVKYEGPESKNPMAFRFYNPEEVVAGKVRWSISP